MDLTSELTPQFMKRTTLDVSILRKVNPASFFVKEMPTLKTSKEYKAFQELENKIQIHYQNQPQRLINLTNAKTLVIVKREDKFYRACIKEVPNTRPKVLFRVYLVDYGKEYQVTKDKLFVFEKKFMEVPFQAVEFVLLGLCPLSMQIDSVNVTLSLRPAIVWDRSAEEYVDCLLNDIVSVQVEILGIDTNGRVHGNLNVITENASGVQSCFCLNTYLVEKQYAFKDTNALKNVKLFEEPCTSAFSLTSLNSFVKQCLFGNKTKLNSSQSSDSEEIRPESGNKCQDITPSPSSIASYKPSLLPSAILNDFPISSVLSERKSLGDDLSKRCLPFGKGGLNGIVNLNHNLSPKSSEKSLPSPSSPALIHDNSPSSLIPEGGLYGGHLIQCLSLGRGLNFTMNMNEIPKSPEKSPSSKMEKSMTTTDSSIRSSIEPEKKGIGGNSPGKGLPGRGINYLKDSNEKEMDIMAKSLKRCEQLRNLIPLVSDVDNIGSCSSNKVAKSPLLSSGKISKILEEADYSDGKMDSKEIVNSINETRQSDSLDGQFSDYESGDDSHEKLANGYSSVSSQNSNATTKKSSKSQSLTNLNSTTLLKNTDKTEVIMANCSNLSSHSFGSQEIAQDMSLELNDHGKAFSTVKPKVEHGFIERDVIPIICNTDGSPVGPGVCDNSSTSLNSPKAEVLRLPFGRARGSLLSTSTTTLDQIKGLLAKRKKSMSPLKEDQRENLSSFVSQPPSHIEQSSPSTEEKIGLNKKKSNLNLFQTSDENYDSTEQGSAHGSCSSMDENPASSQSSSDLFAKKFISNIKDSLSDEEGPQNLKDVFERLESNENHLNPIIKHLNRTATSMSCQLSTVSFQDIIKADLDFSDHSLYDGRNLSVVRIGGETERQWFTTKEANFDLFIQKRLKDMKFCGPSCIQTVLWPMMTKSKAIVAIGPQRSGKTVGYLLPLLSNLISGFEYRKLPKNNGPIVIILCSSWKKVTEVNQQAELFLGQCKKVHVLTLCEDGIAEQKKVISLMNGCHVLIATPHYLQKYWEKKALSFNRCCHLILDDGNDIINHYSNELPPIMDAFVECLGSHAKRANFIQLILCAEHWTMRLAAFIKKYMFHNTALLFSSFLEAAVYSKVPMHVHMCKESTKISQLLSILEGIRGKKISICSTDFSTSVAVHKAIFDAGHNPLYAHEHVLHYHLKPLLTRWHNFESKDKNLVMVITDPSLVSVNFGDSDCIIHYDLPEMSRLQFSNRFSVIREYMQPQKAKVYRNDRAVCHILFTETCRTQATSILTILRRSKSEISVELKQQATSQKQAIKNLNMPLCHHMKALGSCPVNDCNFRHIVDEHLDLPSRIPSQGDIYAIVSHVFSPVHFYLKVLAYIDPKTKTKVSRTAEHASLLIGLQDFFREHKSELKLESDIMMNKLYCVEENKEYHRCKVLEVMDDRQQAKVLYIDEGFIKTTEFKQLRRLPDQFSKQPACAVEAYLCKVKPTDPCPDWHPGITKYMFNLISHQQICAKIILCLGQTLFLDPMVIRTEHLPFIQSRLNLVNLSIDLKSKALAIANKEHVELLYKACCGKVDRPEMFKITSNTSSTLNQVKANWAFLDMDSTEFVYLNHVESPNQFFIQRDKSVDSLEILLKEIAAKVENEILQPCKTLQTGMFCVAPSPSNDSYNRAEILSIIEVSEEILADVRFVDYGDCGKVKKSELFVLPPEFMLLPFQAIECDLAGVKPLQDNWTESAIDTFYDLTRDIDDPDIQIKVKLKALEKNKHSTGRNIYTVDLQTSAGTSVSNYLIKNGFAEEKEMPWQLDYQPTVTAHDSEDDADDDSDGSDDRTIPGEKTCAAMLAGVFLGGINPGNFHEIYQVLEKTPVQEPATHLKENDQSIQNMSSAIDDVEIVPRDPPLNNEDSTKSLHPFVTWWNTIDEVTITIHIPDVQRYDLELYDCGFKFETTVKQKHYVLEETFYDQILKDETKPKCLGSYTEFRFKKKLAADWPRLIKSDKKIFHIKYDPMHVDNLDDEEEDNELPNYAVAESSGVSESIIRHDNEEVIGGELESDEEENANDSFDDEDNDCTPYSTLCSSRSQFDFPS